MLESNSKIVFTGTRVGEDCGTDTGFIRRFTDMLLASVPETKIEIIDRTFADATAATVMQRWHDDILFASPDVLVILLGEKDMYNFHLHGDPTGNPDRFCELYEKIVAETRERLPECRIVIMQPYVALIDRNPYGNGAVIELFPEYLDAVERVAARFSIPLTRCHDRITSIMKAGPAPDLFGSNPVQLDSRGNVLLANMLAETFGIVRRDVSTRLADGDTVLFFGDSITDAGRRDRHRPMGIGYVKLFTDLLFAREPDKHVSFINKGIAGNTVVDLYYRWALDVAPHKPDHLVILIGINDLMRSRAGQEPDTNPAFYRETYDKLLGEITAELPGTDLVLMSPFYMSRGGFPESDRQETMAAIADYIEAVADLSRKYDAEYIDLQKIFQAQLKYRHNTSFGREPIHPHETGQMVIAEALYHKLAEQ